MKTRIMTLFALLTVTAGPQAATVIDQSYTIYGGGTTVNPVAQTFTVGTSGILIGIEANITSSIFYPEAAYSFQVVGTLNGAPNGNPSSVLATINGAAGEFSTTLATAPPYHYFDLSPFNIEIQQNQVLAFIFSTYGTPIQINGRVSNSTYQGGSAFTYSGGQWVQFMPFGSSMDLSFQTYVSTVPVPGTAILLLSGLAGLMVRMRSRGRLSLQ